MQGVTDRFPLTPQAAARELGIHYTHLLRLLRGKRIRRSRLNPKLVDRVSLEEYRLLMKPLGDEQYASASEAADRIGCGRRHIEGLVRDGALRGLLVPRANGAVWVCREDLERLDLIGLAKDRGVRVRVPNGWMSSGETCKALGVSRGTLRNLVLRGELERECINPGNPWYRAVDVTQLLLKRNEEPPLAI